MESSKERTLCFVTWNICGGKKLSPHIAVLSKLGAEIVFLQETNIGPNDMTLENLDGWQCFFTTYDSRSKGVAILLKDGVSFEYICHDEDYTGGYLVLFCRLHGQLFTLVNVYHHKDDKDVLNILTDYLRETAEGVLVVGGDFNTVVDLNFDRKSKAKNLQHTSSSKMFKKFSASLNLIDTWAYRHPTVKKFTYSQNESSSRLDMFLIREEDLEQIINVNIYEHESSLDTSSTSSEKVPSDHLPVYIHLKTKEQTSNKVPNVASWLQDNRLKGEPDRREGKINGAEILSVIKSLSDSGHQRPDGISVQTYKNYSCPLTEILKIYFNHWMKCQQLGIPKDFSTSDDGKHFNVNYLIFTMILAKRLSVLLDSSSEVRSQENTSDCCCVTFAVKPHQIKWSFLANSLSNCLENYLKKPEKQEQKPEKQEQKPEKQEQKPEKQEQEKKPEKQEQEKKPEKQEQKLEKQEQENKPEKQEQEKKPEKQEEKKPEKQEKKPEKQEQEKKPKKQEQEKKPKKQEQEKKPKKQEEKKPEKQEEKKPKKQEQEKKPEKQEKKPEKQEQEKKPEKQEKKPEKQEQVKKPEKQEKEKYKKTEIVIPLKGLVDRDFDSTDKNSILKVILPKASQPSGDFRELQDGCPLTRPILSLVLKYLEIKIREKNYTTHVSHSRQVVVVMHQDYQKCCDDLVSLCKEFKEDSGIELNIVEINNRT